MTVDDAIHQKLETLPVERRQEVLRYIDHLATPRSPRPLKSPRGTAADIADLTPEDFAQLRRELWGRRETRD